MTRKEMKRELNRYSDLITIRKLDKKEFNLFWKLYLEFYPESKTWNTNTTKAVKSVFAATFSFP